MGQAPRSTPARRPVAPATMRRGWLEREVRKLRRASEILKTASAFFPAAELDRKTT
ncbi:transposase-like protein [Amycolatopsis jiangsuensis]|uniref:Transposase-like protein n=1 Tax=Amycolatopsis jiangsuensis TaxID=1181879 RepID=A0A840J7D0_9PSEU|nr:transposase-like protein [Amycolatopsis jiangsuensis]